ncbi:hypothetical protein [Azospirillum brasilense]|uniref:hypothetical protein n=1 Tax=Azospirillum brasilense TaxID=192 RepID=UPI000E6937BC|nr:hypothetical protein [Azospirillum brasilense]NUB25270.1 hypothetical protein [Azospirillum brasilense]NUB30659.1 hypothetical protein [Azospirillum brasilense]RIW08270.1 hypothetical protein D2T81_00730 [Azospirillum brasilense]
MGFLIGFAVWIGSSIAFLVVSVVAGQIFGFDGGYGAVPSIMLGAVVALVRSYRRTKSSREKQIADFRSKGFEPNIYHEMADGDAFVADVEKKKIMILRGKAAKTRLFDFSDIRSVSLMERTGKSGTYHSLHITVKDVNDPLHILACSSRGGGLQVYAKIEAAGIV